ncbi:MAG: hypothetical protein KKH44_12605 [Bacteroidetes bacterium]|nr:hypothetical protein [Bacteroidota bacterium]
MVFNDSEPHEGIRAAAGLLSATAVTSMSKINYYFDAKKLAGTNNITKEDWVRTVFKDMMYNATTQALKQQGNEVFEVIWGNTGLRESLFPGISDKNLGQDKFEEMIETVNSVFYNFIIVK